MARNVLIPIISIVRWNKSEKTKFLTRYNTTLPRPTSSGSEPDLPSVQNNEGEGIPVLHIPAELLEQFDAVLEQMIERNKQTTACVETAQLKQLDEDRIRIAKYVVNRILNGDDLPKADEREAAKAMETEIRPYKDIAYTPVGQRSADIIGLLHDAQKEEFAEYIATLGLTEPLADLQDLNDQYEALSKGRKDKQKIKAEKVSTEQLTAEAEEVINNMNDYANAASLLFPSEEASTFVRDIIKLYDEAREDFNKRGPHDEDEDGEQEEPEEPGGEDETPTEEPDTPGGEDESPTEEPENPDDGSGEDDDRPVVQ